MMFASIVGQAIFHTAERSGPSTMERSKRPGAAGPGGAGVSAGTVGAVGAGVELWVTRDPWERRTRRDA